MNLYAHTYASEPIIRPSNPLLFARRLSQVKPWLAPVLDPLAEHLQVPDFFRHAAAPLPKPELSGGAVLGVGPLAPRYYMKILYIYMSPSYCCHFPKYISYLCAISLIWRRYLV